MQKPATAPPNGEKNVNRASDRKELMDDIVQPFQLSVIGGIPTRDDDQTDWCHACTDMTHIQVELGSVSLEECDLSSSNLRIN